MGLHGSHRRTDLAQYGYGHFTRWIFNFPARLVRQQLSLGVYPANLTDIAATFTKVSGKKARCRNPRGKLVGSSSLSKNCLVS